MSIQQVSIHHRLAKHSTRKLEVIQVVLINATQRVGLKGGTVLPSGEETIIWIKDFSRQDDIPLSSEAACIYALLFMEGHHQPSFHFIWSAEAQLVE